MQEEHDMFRSKPNHCISSGRNMSCSSPQATQFYVVVCGFLLRNKSPKRKKTVTYIPRRTPFWLEIGCRSFAYICKYKKSTTCSGANLTTVSVCVGICRTLPFAPHQAKNATLFHGRNKFAFLLIGQQYFSDEFIIDCK